MSEHVEIFGIMDNLLPFGAKLANKQGSRLFLLPIYDHNDAKHDIWHHSPVVII